MSHQSGITASDKLRAFFAQCKDGRLRLLKVSIVNEKLELDDQCTTNGNWEDDYDATVMPLLEDKMPCYILYRLDTRSSNTGFEWLFISYSPDFAPVRQKMVYASTRATLKKEFGGGDIKEELFGTSKEDVSLAGYHRHLTAQNAPAPLTMAEEELEMIRKTEVSADVSVDTKHQTMTGLSFPLLPDAQTALDALKSGRLNYVQLSLDLTKEVIALAASGNEEPGNLTSRTPADHARYHLYNYRHQHEGDLLTSLVFIYSQPGFKCSIKERMLYSSCKAPFLAHVEQNMGMEISRKLEIDDASELTEEFLYDEIHPKTAIVREKFARPKGPGGRGPKRMTKKTAEEG